MEKFDKKGNLIYYTDSSGFERWMKYGISNNCIHYKDSNGYEYWKKYDGNNRIYYKNSNGEETWFKWTKNGAPIKITEQEYKEIEFRKKEKEYLSRKKCSRFEIMDI